jgi:hypothetical protein
VTDKEFILEAVNKLTKPQIQKARQADLAQYLLSVGVPLKRNGYRHTHADHDSLVFTENAYYWNSKQEKGNAVDYLTKHMGYDFQDAITALTDFLLTERKDYQTVQKEFVGTELNSDCRRAIAYLHKTRGINYALIQSLINQKLLMQQVKTNNIIFPMYDEKGEYVGAELQGTFSERRFKGVVEGSRYGYGFNIRYPNTNGRYQYALFFESAVDLISFIDIKRNYEKKPLTACMLISMAGLKPNIVHHTLKTFGENLKVFLCVDDDEAGRNFIAKLGNGYGTQKSQQGKDWNEQLQKMKML